MAGKPKPNYSIALFLSLKPRFMLCTLFSLLVSIKIVLLATSFHLQKHSLASLPSSLPIVKVVEPPKWVDVIQGHSYKRALTVGLIEFEDNNHKSRVLLGGISNLVTIDIDLEPVSPNVTWNKLFSSYVNDNSTCPEIPMPKAREEEYPTLDVVVARLPCGEGYNRSQNEGIRDVRRLQLSLASAHLIVENADSKEVEEEDVYGVFISECEPMVELFRCDDLIWHEGEVYIYKPNIHKLKEIISLPFGSCQIARPHIGSLGRRQEFEEVNSISKDDDPKAITVRPTREAYVTVLHSSESYVCGAIALAQSILFTNTTKDLVLLADRSISNHSIIGLQAAGWKIKLIDRIRSPFAKLTSYNAWNYSKLRVWQLTEYSKVIFIDADFILLRNLDHIFDYPQLSAASNNRFIFNSGIMLLEPSDCFFKTLMNKRFALESYNGGDQGYLNEIITYWHKLPGEVNYMKYFSDENKAEKERVVSKDKCTIHFLGVKPWACYRDYDCNWDSKGRHHFASDQFHAWWWKVYDAMSKELQMYCRMTVTQDKKVREWKATAQKKKRSDGHWKIAIKDPRQFDLVASA